MSDPLAKALSAVTEALSSPLSPESIDMQTAMQLLGTMDKLRAKLEPANLTVLNLSVAVGMNLYPLEEIQMLQMTNASIAVCTECHSSRSGNGNLQCFCSSRGIKGTYFG